jgi:hypothetical protein
MRFQAGLAVMRVAVGDVSAVEVMLVLLESMRAWEHESIIVQLHEISIDQ